MWCVVETSRGRGVTDVHTIRVLRLRGVVWLERGSKKCLGVGSKKCLGVVGGRCELYA